MAEPPPAERQPEAPVDSWALQVAKPFGIPVRVHFTFVLLLLWVGWSAWQAGSDPLRAALFIVLLFVCVVLHELGHATMALRYGVRTRQIVLYPIGGIASLDRMPEGKAELWIALAGPAVNVVLAGILWAAKSGLDIPWPSSSTDVFGQGALVPRLLIANVTLVVFNLLPAFPMDGGRVLRESLSLFLPRVRATRIAARIGQAVAILFGAAGLFSGNFMLVFIALFVFLGAGQEAVFEQSRTFVTGHTAREAMIRRFDVLQPQDSLGRAADLLLDSHQQDFPVVDAWGRVAGILSRTLLLRGLAQHGREGVVLESMRRDVRAVEVGSPLEAILPLLQSEPTNPVVVLDGGALVGMITLENLSEMMAIAERLRPSGR